MKNKKNTNKKKKENENAKMMENTPQNILKGGFCCYCYSVFHFFLILFFLVVVDVFVVVVVFKSFSGFLCRIFREKFHLETFSFKV